MGEVFLARDTRLERDVAVKLIREEFAADGERLARFEREARAIAALNHPSIVTIYAIEEGSGRRFFTMELVEGRTLREVAPPAGLPAPELLRVGVALADALAAAHARGVVHRDLKPANVMTTHEGRVKVLDFGIAKLDVSGVPTATAAGPGADLATRQEARGLALRRSLGRAGPGLLLRRHRRGASRRALADRGPARRLAHVVGASPSPAAGHPRHRPAVERQRRARRQRAQGRRTPAHHGQLVDVASGYHLWSERFDRTLDDIFAIQDEIAARTAEALRGVLTAQDEAVLRRERREDPRAYDYYLRGRKLLDQLWITRFEVAREMFRKAIEIDPQFARGWANISLTHADEYAWFGRRPEHLAAALAAARRAVELDPDLAEGRAAAGFALAFGDRFQEARDHFERALEIGPASWEAHFLYGRACWAQGDMIRSAELFARATEIAPDDYQAPALAVQPLLESGQPERAERFPRVTVERVRLRVERHPDDGRALYMSAIALQRLGELERALEWGRRAVETSPPEDVATHYNLGCFYARMGERDKALERLEQCVSLAGGFREWIAHDRDWDSLRGDPRFEELLNRLP